MLVGALVVKAAVLFVVLPAVSDSVAPGYSIGFADLYDLIGLNVSQGNGYRAEAETTTTMIREPGYPLFLAAVFRVAGYHLEAARFANLLLSLGIGFMMLRLVRTLTGDATVALLATLLFLFHPGTILSEARGGIEIVFIFVVMLFMLALHRAVDSGQRWHYFVAGLSLGVAVMFRGSPMLFPAFLFAYLVLVQRTLSERIRAAQNVGVLVIGMVLVMMPWVIRNYRLTQRLVLTATVQGVAAQEGQFTCRHLDLQHQFRDLQTAAAGERNQLAAQLGEPFRGFYYQIFYTPRAEMAFNDSLLQHVSATYRTDPMLAVNCTARNLFFNFWFLGKPGRSTALNAVAQLPFLACAMAGVYLIWKRGLLQRMSLILGFIAYIVAVHVVIIAHARHSVPLVPFLSVLASVSLLAIWDRWRNRETATGRSAITRSSVG